jgi:hypothetical protein
LPPRQTTISSCHRPSFLRLTLPDSIARSVLF